MAKQVMKTERHIRWNWEVYSKQSDLVNYKIRYHFIVVDDKDREGIMNQISNQLQISGTLELVREQQGVVKDSRLMYLFKSFDSRTAPKMLDFSKIGKLEIKDPDLIERARGGIENYVANLYSY